MYCTRYQLPRTELSLPVHYQTFTSFRPPPLPFPAPPGMTMMIIVIIIIIAMSAPHAGDFRSKLSTGLALDATKSTTTRRNVYLQVIVHVKSIIYDKYTDKANKVRVTTWHHTPLHAHAHSREERKKYGWEQQESAGGGGGEVLPSPGTTNTTPPKPDDQENDKLPAPTPSPEAAIYQPSLRFASICSGKVEAIGEDWYLVTSNKYIPSEA